MTTATEDDLASFKTLAKALVKTAIADLAFDPTPKQQTEHVAMVRAEAREWILSESTEHSSFLRMCAIANINPYKLRRKLGYATD